jgi:hypothetical protein
MTTTKKEAIAAQLKPTVYRLTNLVVNPKTDKATQAVATDCIVDLMAMISELEFDKEKDNA